MTASYPRFEKLKAGPVFCNAHYCFADRAVDDRLANMDRAALRADLGRKHDELTRTFVRRPAWVSALLPHLMIAALRLEISRSFEGVVTARGLSHDPLSRASGITQAALGRTRSGVPSQPSER